MLPRLLLLPKCVCTMVVMGRQLPAGMSLPQLHLSGGRLRPARKGEGRSRPPRRGRGGAGWWVYAEAECTAPAGSSNELIIVRAGAAGFGPPRAATRAGEGTRAAGLGRCPRTRVFRPRPTAQGSGIPGSPETAPTGPAGARLLPQRWPRALRSTRRRALGAEQRAFILQVGKLKPREMK